MVYMLADMTDMSDSIGSIIDAPQKLPGPAAGADSG